MHDTLTCQDCRPTLLHLGTHDTGKAVRMMFGDGFLERYNRGGRHQPFEWEVRTAKIGVPLVGYIRGAHLGAESW